MGTPDFAKESLETLYNANHEIALVITAPDKPKGRGMKLTASPVKEYAISKKLQIEQPEKITGNNEILEKIKQANPDVLCVVAYGKILPKEILTIAKKGAINVHGSLLPKYRGAAPIQWAILNGEEKTGITTMFMNEKLDEGDMLLKEEVKISKDETFGELWQRLAKTGANLLIETLKLIEKNQIIAIPQPNEATYAPKLSKEIAKIDWENKTAGEIKNLVRGLNPIMGAYTFLNGTKIKFWKIDVVSYEEFIEKFNNFNEFAERIKKIEPGTVMHADPKQGLYVKTKDTIISVLEIQGENAKRMSINEYLRGNEIRPMQMFECY